jgi:hypothetical protein
MDTQAAQALERHPVVVSIIQKDDMGRQPRAFVISPQIRIGMPPTVSKVIWKNDTREDARLWFPNGGRVFKDQLDYKNPLPIKPGGSKELEVKPNPELGDYHYHVYCEAVQDCAQGNSEPRLSVP